MRWALLAIAPLLGGCLFQYEAERNLPGKISNLASPPSDLRARTVDRGEDPGQRGWLAHVTLLGGGVIDQRTNGGSAGFELGAVPFAFEHSESPEKIVVTAQQRTWIRPSVGWMFYDESNLRITRGRTYSGVGPVYAEVQVFPWQGPLGAFMIGAGPVVDVSYPDGGAQATLCGGLHPALWMFCVRGSALANRGAEIGIFASISALGTYTWSK